MPARRQRWWWWGRIHHRALRHSSAVFSCCSRSECQPPTVQPKSCSRWRRAGAAPRPRQETLLRRRGALRTRAELGRPGWEDPCPREVFLQLKLQSSLEIFGDLFSSNICIIKISESPLSVRDVRRSDPRTSVVRGEGFSITTTLQSPQIWMRQSRRRTNLP